MRIKLSLLAAALAAMLPLSAPAEAQLVSELKVGGAYHDPPIFGPRNERKGFDINGEVLFTSPGFLSFLWSPRPHVGLQVNTAGLTNQAYAGLTWQYDFDAGPFIAGSLGLAVHDGELDSDRTDRKSLGGRVLFRESIEVGFRFGEERRHSLSLMLSHVSNAGIYERNEGMDTIAARYGLRF
ncbi:MAG: acyloxyacyl hydrolase [Alphaproteobacteria bacterium]|nr:acyloxyacyl hydrolase [Alphaproteobacteria bacterium]